MRIRRYLKHEDHRRLLTNIFSLGTIQIVNYVLPLLTVPYLVRILEPDYFGLLAFATATITYFALITDYGFNLSATRQVSIHRDDFDKVNEIFSATMIIKFFLMFFSFLILCILVFFIDKFKNHWDLYMITFGMVVGQFLFPIWLFQGKEKMKYITFINVSTKVLFTLSIFALVKEQDDYLLVQGLTSAGFIISGIFSMILVKLKFRVFFYLPSWDILKKHFKDGWYIFTSTLAISLFTTSTTFILGLFTNNTLVGYYAAAEKIVQAVKGLNGPVSQSIYPLISKKIHTNLRTGVSFIYKIGKVIVMFSFLISMILFIFAEPISDLLLGDQYKPSIVLLRIMSFLPLIISISNLCAVQGLYNMGKADLVSKYLSLIGIAHVLLICLLIPFFGIIGAAIGVVITEILGTIFSIYYFKRELRSTIGNG
ncbi:flippase [Belliella kenyensis]|uniref:Flippase n=1 Tax=Belliella kenyensis TaxID=1472724 RepID=A0ABV8EPE5_9BACT|nr:flippase [Belliella kenyensis]MCH7401638.1 flippase [Belliella kenyensis]MDN3603084.1 flippase [Belliella kenyensis]